MSMDATKRTGNSRQDDTGHAGPTPVGAPVPTRPELQARMDAELSWWNDTQQNRLTPADEFGVV